MSEATDYRRQCDDLLRQTTRAGDLNERSRLISQAIRFNEMAIEAERLAAEQRIADATIEPFLPSPDAS